MKVRKSILYSFLEKATCKYVWPAEVIVIVAMIIAYSIYFTLICKDIVYLDNIE